MARGRLTRAGERSAKSLIERYDLHHRPSALPIPIRQVAKDEGWTIAYASRLAPLYGYAIVAGGRLFMRINSAVTDSYQRMAIAHEMGHVLNGDIDRIHLCTASPFESWIDRRQELRASLVAAQILIPAWVIRDVGSIHEIATRCEVPVELVELRAAH